MSSVVKNVMYAFGSRYFSLLIQLISITVVSRLLTPEDIGIYSISASLFGFLLLIRDFGIGSYIIQEKNLTNDTIASAFAMSLLLCWGLAGVMYGIKPFLAEFYALPQMESILTFLTINLLLIPFGSITLSILKRNMMFQKVMIVDVVSAAANTTTTIWSALEGHSYMSLAYGSLAGTTATVLMASFYRPQGLPFLPGVKRLKDVASFGWKISGSNIFSQIHSSSPDLIIGKVQGPVEAVYFNKTVSVFKLFNQLFQNALRPVYQSYVAKINNSGENLKDPILLANNLYLILAWAFAGVLVIHSEAVILILFGGQWTAIAPLVQIMCISHALSSVFVFHQTTLVGLGKADKVLRLSMILAIAQFSIILAYSSLPLEAIFVGLIAMPLIRFLAIKNDLRDMLGVGFRDMLFLASLPFRVFLVMLTINYLGAWLLDAYLGSIASFLVLALVSALALLLMLVTSSHSAHQELVNIFINLKKKSNP